MIDATLNALSDPTRRRVVELLGEAPRRAGELAQETRMSRPAMSRHLRILRSAGIIEEAPDPSDGRARLQHLRSTPLRELRSWLDEVQDFWSGQLDAFAQHLTEDSDGP